MRNGKGRQRGEELEEAPVYIEYQLTPCPLLGTSTHLPPVSIEMTLKSGYFWRPTISSNLPKILYMIGKCWGCHLTQV